MATGGAPRFERLLGDICCSLRRPKTGSADRGALKRSLLSGDEVLGGDLLLAGRCAASVARGERRRAAAHSARWRGLFFPTAGTLPDRRAVRSPATSSNCSDLLAADLELDSEGGRSPFPKPSRARFPRRRFACHLRPLDPVLFPGSGGPAAHPLDARRDQDRRQGAAAHDRADRQPVGPSRREAREPAHDFSRGRDDLAGDSGSVCRATLPVSPMRSSRLARAIIPSGRRPQRTGCCHFDIEAGWSVNYAGRTSRAAGWRSTTLLNAVTMPYVEACAASLDLAARVPLGPPARPPSAARVFQERRSGRRSKSTPGRRFAACLRTAAPPGNRVAGPPARVESRAKKSRGYRSVDRTLGACRRFMRAGGSRSVK